MIKYIGFDKDGTLIDDVGYINSVDDFCWLPGVLSSLSEINNLGYKMFVKHFTIHSYETILYAKTN